MSILIGLFTAVHVVVALFVIILVLMQKSSEQGVGAAFGGGMTETVFGAGTTTALVRMTIWCAGLLLATTLILAVLHSHRTKTGGSLMQRVIAATPVAPPTTQPAFPLASQPPASPAPGTASATPSAPAQTPVQNPPSAPPASQPGPAPQTP